jgi:hypothetical protein
LKIGKKKFGKFVNNEFTNNTIYDIIKI